MKVLLLGGTGQVGRELHPRLVKEGHQIVAPNRDELPLNDLNAVKQFLGNVSPHLIINAAAYTAVDKAETEVEQAFKLNAHLPDTLAQFCKAREIPLIHYSSDYVYDGSGEQAWRETDEVNPLSIYGKSKLAGDRAIISSQCNALIFRTCWVVSEHGKNFIKTMLALGQSKPALTIVADQFGAPTSAELIAEVTMAALVRLENSEIESGVYHLSSSGEASWYDIAQYVFQVARQEGCELSVSKDSVTPVPTTDYPTPAERPKNSRLNCEKLEKALNIKLRNWQLDIEKIVKKLLHKDY